VAAMKRVTDAVRTANQQMEKSQLVEGPWPGPHWDDNHLKVHPPEKCGGTYCAIHNPSPHFMQFWPRSVYALRVWRKCSHGTRHPDPDDVAYWVSRGKSQAALQKHDCDGCCAPAIKVQDV